MVVVISKIIVQFPCTSGLSAAFVKSESRLGLDWRGIRAQRGFWVLLLRYGGHHGRLRSGAAIYEDS